MHPSAPRPHTVHKRPGAPPPVAHGPPPAVATLGSHCALQVLKGASDEGLGTLLICDRRRARMYRRFGFIGEIVEVGDLAEAAGGACAAALERTGAVLVPHGTLIARLDPGEIESIGAPIFGNRWILRWESDRALKEQMMREAGLRLPRSVASPDEISSLCIVKRQGAAGGRGYFMASSRAEYDEKLGRLVADGTVSAGEPLYIQEYVPGVLAYLQFFYSPLRGEAEFFGADQRHESDIEGLARMPAPVQMAAPPGRVPSFNVIGNTPIALRESLLAEAYDMADRFVAASRRLVGPGMTGPFCIEGVYDGDGEFTAFEFSARIVAGTNIHMDGSPYCALLHGEPMSMGRRIAREIRAAAEAGRLDAVTT